MMRGRAVQRAAAVMREMARALLAPLLLAVLSLAAAQPLRAAEFQGGYDGIGEAAGMALTLSEVERRVVGRLTLPSGVTYTLNGERAEVAAGSAQGALRVSGAASDGAFFHIEERPLGLQFLFIPAKSEGTPDLASASEYSFLKKGVRPTLSSEAKKKYRDAPAGPVDIVAFIDGFRGWSPGDVARLYAALPRDARGLVLLHDHATAELMWRICEAELSEGSAEAAALSEMQERQQTECAAYLPVVHAAQKSGLFPEFLRRSQFQLELIRATVLCDRGESPPARCADVSALAAPLILRWRRADAIMRGLVRPEDDPGDRTAEMAPIPDAEFETVAETQESIAEMEAAPAPMAQDAPFPLPRPGGGEGTGEEIAEEAAMDFLPDTSPLTLETIRLHRLPLVRPE